jgi:mannose-6-phosphate isomerase-like protein (cupin superfamily)
VDAFELDDLVSALDTSKHDFAEFFRAERLSLTVTFWPAGSVDDQTPHTEDEVYYVASGRARIEVAGKDSPVGPGSIVYVAAGVEHRFHSIEEDLKVLVFWAPPRHSLEA